MYLNITGLLIVFHSFIFQMCTMRFILGLFMPETSVCTYRYSSSGTIRWKFLDTLVLLLRMSKPKLHCSVNSEILNTSLIIVL